MSAAVMTSPQAANVSSSAPANNRDTTPGAGDKAAPLKMKISTNHADGTSKVVSSNNSSNKNHNHHHHHHHHSSSSSSKSGDKKDGAGHKSSSGSSSHNKPVADGEKVPAKVSSGDKHKNHVSSKSSSSGDKNAVKPKDSSSNSKPKENHTSSSKDGKPHSSSSSSSKPKDGSEKKSSSSSHNNSSSNKMNSSSSSGSKDGKSKSHLSSNDKNKVVSKDGTKSNSTSSSGDKHSSSKHNNSNSSSSHKHTSSSSSKDPKASIDKKKSSGGDNTKSSSGGGDSVKHKSSGDKSKHRDKENQEKDKQQTVKIKQEPGTATSQKTTEKPVEKVKVKSEPKSPPRIKAEVLSDEDVPLAKRKQEAPSRSVRVKQEKRSYKENDDSEDEPLASRLQKAKKVKAEGKKRKMESDSEDEQISKRIKKEPPSSKKAAITTASPMKTTSPTKKKKEEEGKDVWKWWEEEKKSDGSKWHTLEHKGPVFAPEYEPLPKHVKFLYNGKLLHLSEPAEEVATMYAKFLEHDYTSKEAFNKNFFKDWRKVMTPAERETIMDLKKCDFKPMHTYFTELNEQRKTKTKEEKQIIKRKNEEMLKEFGFCVIDGHKEKIGNFKTEPPGLFRGRGEHPKMGMLKKRIMPEDVIINCSRGSKVPSPPPGHKWKEVRHDNTVTWLACWQENIQNQTKYIMLNPSSKLKGEKDWQKYETARKLKSIVEKIREQYRADWKSKEMKVRQRAVALYFIDKLALRAGNEKEEGETADTVGCCSLRVEHITLDEEKDGDENVVSFDFLGKDSIRYYNSVPVEKRVFKNLGLFMDNKQPGDDLFDRLNTTILNKHLNELMDGLTAKVFRTFNASKTLQEQLLLLTNPADPLPAKLLSYNRANRAVAILCNHQRAVPKTFGKSMENLQTKINDKKAQVKEAQKELKEVKKSVKNGRSDAAKTLIEKKEKALERLKDQLVKLDLQATDKEENKQIALGTSKLNYLDPRISVAWCKKWEVPIEKIYNRTQRDKFRWAIEMATPDFKF